MKNIFNSISARKPRRNLFDLSHDVKLSCNMGELVPVCLEECVPGDKFQINSQAFVRLAPMLAPVMHRMDVYIHYFFVPNRLVWDDWQDFITGGPNGDLNPVFPRYSVSSSAAKQYFAPGSLADYLGIGYAGDSTSTSTRFEVSQLPFRAYNFIWNEYYRDQNLQLEQDIPLTSGILTDSQKGFQDLVNIRRRAWQKDYFTSALPWTQRGPEVRFPISGNADVIYDANGNTEGLFRRASTGDLAGDGDARLSQGRLLSTDDFPGRPNNYDPNGTLKADLAGVSGTTVNEFRRSIRLQEWFEKNARAGGRYFEQILSHFGVKSPDARLQRPEFIGGGKSPVTFSEVVQTSSSDATSPQANPAGHGVTALSSMNLRYYCQEHGYIMGIMSILPKTAYQQGIPRHFRKFDRFDFYFPEFANLGEQPIYQSELYADISKPDTFDEVFGYTPRYAEYKNEHSRVAGDFKTNLNFWHMSRIFGEKPTLSSSFVSADDIDRIFAVSDQGKTDKFWCQVRNNIRAIRPMPRYGTPLI